MIARRASLAIGALALCASLAGAQQRQRDRMSIEPGPNPSAIVSAELAFARMARERGQWTAFRETADEDAIMFAPGPVNAREWLKKRAEPAQVLSWAPRAVYVSCDGGYAVSTGPWTHPDGSSGTFITLWRRQRNGSFKWVIDFGSNSPFPAAANGDDLLIDGKVADCAGRQRDMARFRRDREERMPVVPIPNPPPASGEGQSVDGSLRWRWSSGPSERKLAVTMRYQGGEQTVIDQIVPVAAP